MTAEPARKLSLFGENGARVQPKELEEAKSIVVQAQGLQPIKPYDAEAKGLVSNIIRGARDMIKLIKDHHDPIKRSAKRTHEIACEKEREALKPVEEALNRAQSLLNACANEERLIEQKKRDEAERKAQEEAAERRAVAAKKIEEVLGKAEGLTEQAKLIELTLENEDTTQEEAQILRRKLTIIHAQIENDEAQLAAAQYEVEEAPVYVPAVETQKVEGIGKGTKVSVEVKSLRELCAAIGRGEVPVAAVKEVPSKLNGYARDQMKLPGCIIHREAKAVVR